MLGALGAAGALNGWLGKPLAEGLKPLVPWAFLALSQTQYRVPGLRGPSVKDVSGISPPFWTAAAALSAVWYQTS